MTGHEKQLASALLQGWDIAEEPVKSVKVKPNTTYYLLVHGWSCSQCAARVTVGDFSKHARRHK
ncbi:hypothetical protein BH789_gp077 [Gordonia phage GMA6]|uniref:Uncharacterized protein n=1 Tax=Gordonia phage GMA6 TaxID=1647285 RepID=A0A0K0NL97_9CAUD|nr:hypothetical protein BH789_gp077 [Gordonia phage GMA6]AKL88358.1 hypothetical protein GMA6_77 [Gordonia phage GMA6]